MAPGKRRRTAEENGANGNDSTATTAATSGTTSTVDHAKTASKSDANSNHTTAPIGVSASEGAVSSSSSSVVKEGVAMDVLCAEYDAIITQLEGKYSFVRALLNEFWETLRKDPRLESGLVIENDAEWFWFAEMKYLIIFLYEMAFMEFSMSVTKPDLITVGDKSNLKETLSNRENMQERVEFLVRFFLLLLQTCVFVCMHPAQVCRSR